MSWIKVQQVRNPGRIVLIDDLRYPAEAEVLMEHFNTLFLKVVMPGAGTPRDHSSETSMDDFECNVEITTIMGT